MTTGLKTPSNYYIELMTTFPPRPITNEAEYQATQEQINKILERPQLTEDDRAYLQILGLTIYDYEEKHEKIPVLTGVDLIKALLEESNLTLPDLVPILGNETVVQEILNKEQMLSPESIEKLSSFFQVPADKFYP